MQLIREQISRSTVEAFQQMLEGAVTGHYVGAVVGLILPRRRYTVHCFGEACRNPTFARGVCLALDDELRHLIHHDGPETKF
jgi:hypothetical protein